MVISTCSSGSEKLRQEDCGFEGSLSYNSQFQASLAIYSKTISEVYVRLRTVLDILAQFARMLQMFVMPSPHVCSPGLK